ncbi:MAG: hypothetical protein Ct9H90mP16_10200 [Candidatus Poseidoniales archaeon]|nr:MAG: hypothetical protein Ct9H90mP16_10200 [Candidatus Poseidoniales archaeon]
MTDSGTFQNYVYGDVEVGIEEIVTFQREIGVDIATMLDVFGTPDMTKEEVEEAVRETIARAGVSIDAAEGTLLNGPIQGGVHADLRAKSAVGMAEHGFGVHPIGGIVPLMERQRYRELVEIILACREHIPWNRPVHIFGCGHPHLFPICVALGADLFDSAAYALFARDDRMLMPWGTVKLGDIAEFPIATEALAGHTPASVMALADDARCELLARHNLEVTASELARCRQAIRDGTIWKLVEERSHTNAALREATEYLYEHMPAGLVSATNPLRMEVCEQVRIYQLRHQLWLHWVASSPPMCPVPSRPFSSQVRRSLEGQNRRIGSHHCPKVAGCGGLHRDTHGSTPYSLEDVSPWTHLMGPKSIWSSLSEEDIEFDLEAMLGDVEKTVRISIDNGKQMNLELIESALGSGVDQEVERVELDRKMIADKVRYFLDVDEPTSED